MALTIDGIAQYITKATALVTAAPLTMCAWVNFSTNNPQVVMDVDSGPTTPNGSGFDLQLHSSVMRSEAYDDASSADDLSNATSSVTTSVWSHVAAVFTSSISRTVYLNGVQGTTTTPTVVPAGLNTSNVGANVYRNAANTFTGGVIAFPCYWSVALTAVDIACLAQGAGPRKVRPGSLVGYARLTGGLSPTPDLVSSTAWTLISAPPEASNPRIFCP